VNVWMPARFILTPTAIPPNPAPTTTTFGVPAGPNRSSALRLTNGRAPGRQPWGTARASTLDGPATVASCTRRGPAPSTSSSSQSTVSSSIGHRAPRRHLAGRARPRSRARAHPAPNDPRLAYWQPPPGSDADVRTEPCDPTPGRSEGATLIGPGFPSVTRLSGQGARPGGSDRPSTASPGVTGSGS
jgi:hypothetical protein